MICGWGGVRVWCSVWRGVGWGVWLRGWLDGWLGVWLVVWLGFWGRDGDGGCAVLEGADEETDGVFVFGALMDGGVVGGPVGLDVEGPALFVSAEAGDGALVGGWECWSGCPPGGVCVRFGERAEADSRWGRGDWSCGREACDACGPDAGFERGGACVGGSGDIDGACS